MNSSIARIRGSASKDLCPPLSSDKDCFQTPPNATRTSRPSKKLLPSRGSSFAIVPGNRVENMDPKSLDRRVLLKSKQRASVAHKLEESYDNFEIND